ncbi:Exosome complex component RRP46 [Neolecta irregularis DAH-3]|uniref:Exosome complex component RRP46 n=1 Tax=Neolecta irregularis (strain DAH-3) TaxID=1198029 RepID=A0A1U7LGB1_NEOID|nr:Exosome complex component RRP46 [Neolecta irregularis DAH-3]|eukprot:OLL21687.1 Exosome complex component RRP46 [Neolecta irregularis DAH-3]
MTVSAEFPELHKADGSACWKTDVTEVICSVAGPIEVKQRDELPGEAALEPVIGKLKADNIDTREKLMERLVRKAIAPIILVDQHPRTLIQIVCQVISVGAPDCLGMPLVLAAALNATCLALIDAGISLDSTISATAIALSADGVISENPDKTALLNAKSTHVVCYNVQDRAVFSESNGSFSWDEFSLCLRQARGFCLKSHELMYERLTKKISTDIR